MSDKEKHVSEKLGEIIEDFILFPVRYVRTTFTLLFESKLAFSEIYKNHEGNYKNYVPPLTYFVVSYFIFTTISYLFWAIDSLNNWVLDDDAKLPKEVIYQVIYKYFQNIKFDYLLNYSLPPLVVFYILIKLFSFFSDNSQDRDLLKNKLFYFISSIPLLPAILTAAPSILTGEPTLHGDEEADNVFIVSMLFFIISGIYVFIVSIKLLQTIIRECSSLNLKNRVSKIIFVFLCLLLQFIYCTLSLRINDDLRALLLKTREEQQSILRNDVHTPDDALIPERNQ